MMSKLLSMHDAAERDVTDGASAATEGFTSPICFAARHEIIRQGRRDLTLISMMPGLIYDQEALNLLRRVIEPESLHS